MNALESSTSAPPASASSARLPLVTYVLAAGVFLMGTTEFVVAGILPQIATDLGVSVSRAGLMITVFAFGMIVGTPAMAIATLKLDRRLTLTSVLLLFALAHIAVALTSSFTLILIARFLTALATGAFWAVAAVVAAKEAGPAASRALGIVLGGGMLANAVGVPLGALAGQVMGWRGPFWILAALAMAAAVLIYAQVHSGDDAGAPAPSVCAEVAALKDVRVWLVLACCAIVCGSSLAAYSFISPLLTGRTGLGEGAVPFVLLVYGLGALLGSLYGGKLGVERPYGVMYVSATMTFLSLAGLIAFSHVPVLTIVLVFTLGLFGMSTNPILIGKSVAYASHAPTLASAMSTSSFNVGTMLGSWVAGLALETSLGLRGPVVVGTVVAALYLLPLSILLMRDRKAAAEAVERIV
ncbi:MFS transporter [Actinomyces faecalis]|uniref:MFS transporter n=1 Tax=Actinomyces faecalis TaxID=2722820 RepID=UPI001554F2CA|nr:MFS transporter [Actinomyces faecalis]